MVPRVTSRIRYLTNIALFAFALYAAVYGVTYAYRLHHLVNALCAWLFLIHLSAGSIPFPLAQLVQHYFPRPSHTEASRTSLVEETGKEEAEGQGGGRGGERLGREV